MNGIIFMVNVGKHASPMDPMGLRFFSVHALQSLRVSRVSCFTQFEIKWCDQGLMSLMEADILY